MKERVVGAVVLISAGLLLWMILFPANETSTAVDRQTQIPPQMVVDKPAYMRPTRPQNVPEPNTAVSDQPVEKQKVADRDPQAGASTAPKSSSPRAAPAVTVKEQEITSAPTAKTAAPRAEKPVAKPKTVATSNPKPKPAAVSSDEETGLAEAWVIQVATFGQRSNAEAFSRKLRTDGHKAYFKRISGKNGDLYQVFVGPKLNRSLLETEQFEIERRHKVKTLITRYRR